MQGIVRLRVELLCNKCGVEGIHSLLYSDNILIDSHCLNCGWKVNFCKESLLIIYTECFVHRILSKPKKISKELKQDLNHAMQTLPRRMITKPYRVANEIRDMLMVKD